MSRRLQCTHEKYCVPSEATSDANNNFESSRIEIANFSLNSSLLDVREENLGVDLLLDCYDRDYSDTDINVCGLHQDMNGKNGGITDYLFEAQVLGEASIQNAKNSESNERALENDTKEN